VPGAWKDRGKRMNENELLAKYRARKREIAARLARFEAVGRGSGRALFEELAFCLLTPQSKALSCDAAIRELKDGGLLYSGSVGEIAHVLAKRTRFHNNKAKYIMEARQLFGADGFAALKKATFGGSEHAAREYFLKNVKGLGLKEASHYLRNVGRGSTLAILDRHIMKNLVECRAIGRLPKSLTRKKYLGIEEKMAEYCKKTGVPLAHLDLLFWAEETGQIFK
jgi:N-glycosylase/DNA lyase